MYVYKELLFPKALTALSHPFLISDLKQTYLPSGPFHTWQWSPWARSGHAAGVQAVRLPRGERDNGTSRDCSQWGPACRIHGYEPAGESEVSVAQSCLTLCNPMGCSPPGSSVHGILQAKILE